MAPPIRISRQVQAAATRTGQVTASTALWRVSDSGGVEIGGGGASWGQRARWR